MGRVFCEEIPLRGSDFPCPIDKNSGEKVLELNSRLVLCRLALKTTWRSPRKHELYPRLVIDRSTHSN